MSFVPRRRSDVPALGGGARTYWPWEEVDEASVDPLPLLAAGGLPWLP